MFSNTTCFKYNGRLRRIKPEVYMDDCEIFDIGRLEDGSIRVLLRNPGLKFPARMYDMLVFSSPEKKVKLNIDEVHVSVFKCSLTRIIHLQDDEGTGLPVAVYADPNGTTYQLFHNMRSHTLGLECSNLDCPLIHWQREITDEASSMFINDFPFMSRFRDQTRHELYTKKRKQLIQLSNHLYGADIFVDKVTEMVWKRYFKYPDRNAQQMASMGVGNWIGFGRALRLALVVEFPQFERLDFVPQLWRSQVPQGYYNQRVNVKYLGNDRHIFVHACEERKCFEIMVPINWMNWFDTDMKIFFSSFGAPFPDFRTHVMVIPFLGLSILMVAMYDMAEAIELAGARFMLTEGIWRNFIHNFRSEVDHVLVDSVLLTMRTMVTMNNFNTVHFIAKVRVNKYDPVDKKMVGLMVHDTPEGAIASSLYMADTLHQELTGEACITEAIMESEDRLTELHRMESSTSSATRTVHGIIVGDDSLVNSPTVTELYDLDIHEIRET